MRYLWIALLIINTPVFASDPYWTGCNHIETVTGIDDWKPEIKVGSLSDFDGKSYIIIDGWLETASTGYTYRLQRDELTNGVQNIKLKLIAPEIGGAAISKLPITARFEQSEKINKITIHIEKDFNWGPKIINCDL